MNKTLTISLEQEVYDELCRTVGPDRVSRFIEDLVKPHVLEKDLEDGYRQMAEDKEYEAEALEWIEGLIGDVADEEG